MLASTTAVVLDEVITSGGSASVDVPRMAIVVFGAFAITSFFAVWTASTLGLPTFLLLSPLSSRRRWWRIGVYGVGAGILISLTSGALYLTTATAPFRPSPVYNLDSHLKVFALSARAAFSEETMFRLFAIPFFVSLGMRLDGWRPRFGFGSRRREPAPLQRPPYRLVLIALLASALLFGLAHSTHPVVAAGFGLLLGVVYLRAGWEGAVTAHFLGNYLLFAGIYLLTAP